MPAREVRGRRPPADRRRRPDLTDGLWGRRDDERDPADRHADVLEDLANSAKGVRPAFDWIDTAGAGERLRAQREEAEIEELRLRRERREEELEALRTRNRLTEERMWLENVDAARRSLVRFVLGLLKIGSSAVLLVLLVWIVVHLMTMSDTSVDHLSSLRVLVDQLPNPF